jgi:PHD/YefM family antitoxin component YafN of YafNO toxin-antitoxin module
VTSTVPVHSNDTALSELLAQTADGGLVHLTKDGRLAAVVLSRQAYDELLLALSADARHELADIIEQSRRDVAQAGLDRSVVDEAIAAVRSR